MTGGKHCRRMLTACFMPSTQNNQGGAVGSAMLRREGPVLRRQQAFCTRSADWGTVGCEVASIRRFELILSAVFYMQWWMLELVSSDCTCMWEVGDPPGHPKGKLSLELRRVTASQQPLGAWALASLTGRRFIQTAKAPGERVKRPKKRNEIPYFL